MKANAQSQEEIDSIQEKEQVIVDKHNELVK